MIEKSPVVKISNKKYEFYSLDFQNNGSDSPSTLMINYVNSSGALSHVPLGSYSTMTEIQVFPAGSSAASFVFKGFAVSSKISESPGSNTLSVKYIDESNILDQKIIGLKSKFGEGFESVSWGDFKNILLIGKELSECDLDTSTVTDNCSPCLDDAGDKLRQVIDCVERSKYEIRDIVYSFDELLALLTSAGIQVGKVPAGVNTSYYARYVGTVRTVLNNWCDDYGISFYWDYELGIQFIDLKNGITINDTAISQSDCRILSKEKTNSIENNTSNDFIAYFGQSGSKLSYECSKSSLRAITLKPLLVRDLIMKGTALDKQIKEYYGTVEQFYMCCVLSTYSRALRDMYVTYKIYEAEKALDMIPFIEEKDANGNVTKKGKILHLLGNMKILKVLASKKSNPGGNVSDRDGFHAFLNQFPKERVKDLIDRDMYMMIAERSDKIYDRFFEIEEAIGKNFIGRYWYRFFSTPTRQTSVSINAPDGDAKYYSSGDEMTFDFLNYLPTSIGIIGEFIKEDKKGAKSGNTKASDNFIMMKRAAAWTPEQGTTEIQKSIEEISKYAIMDLGNEDFLNTASKDSRMYGFFDMPQRFEVKIETEATNPIEEEKKNQVFKKDSMILTYGLRSAKCEKINIRISNDNKFSVFTPAQSFDMPSSTTSGAVGESRIRSHGGYKVLIENPVPPAINVAKKKAEYIFGKSFANKNSVQTSLNYRNVTQDLFKLIKEGLKIENGRIVCERDENELKRIIEEFSNKLSLQQPVVQETISYTLGGFITSKININDGLVSLAMRYDGNNGFVTYITFSNIQKRKQSQTISIKEFERFLNNNNPVHQTYFDTTGVPPSEVI